jgi:hypothetical protein
MLFRKNVIEKSFMNWRVLPLIKINTRISHTPEYTGSLQSMATVKYLENGFSEILDIW